MKHYRFTFYSAFFVLNTCYLNHSITFLKFRLYINKVGICYIYSVNAHDLDILQPSNPGTDHSELMGNTSVDGNGCYWRTRTEGG